MTKSRDRSWEDKYRSHWSWEETSRVTHPQDCYPGNCSFVAYLKDGRVLREEQTGTYPPVDPDTPDWNPRGCNKGCLYSDVTYGDERIRQPMKQTGPRGSGQWEPISWEQALREVANSLLDALEENPQSLVLEPPVEGGTFQAMSPFLTLVTGLGGTVLDEVAEISDISAGLYTTFGKCRFASSQDDWFKADLNIVWHMNPVYTRIPGYHFLTENRYAGGELVTIAPDVSPSCVHADRYVPVNPATDAALCLGMIRVILKQGLEAEEFIAGQTDLPFLVREDNGRFLRESDLVAEGDPEQFYVWDREEGLAPVTKNSLDERGGSPALRGSFPVEGTGGPVEVTPVMERLRRTLREDYHLERVQQITGVHPEVVRELAAEVATRKTNVLLGFNTGKTFHGDLIERAICLLLAVTGNWGKPGTGIRSWCSISEPGMVYGEGEGDGFRDLARFVVPDENPTDEQLTMKSSMIQASFGVPSVPPVFFWYRHAGFADLWDSACLEEAGIPRRISDYLQEALEEGWWRNLDRPDRDVTPRVLLTVGNNVLRRTRGGTRVLLEELWPQLEKIITVDFRWSTTALYSDLVLPAAFFYEKPQFHMLTSSENRFWAFADRAVDPVHESRSEWSMVHQLTRVLAGEADRRGIDEFEVPHGMTSEKIKEVIGKKLTLPDPLKPLMGKNRTIEGVVSLVTEDGAYDASNAVEALDHIVEKCKKMGIFGEGESLDKIRERGFVKYQGLGSSVEGENMATEVEPERTVTPLTKHVQEGIAYPTLTGRAQFYIDHDWFLEANEALPVHKPPPNQGGNYPYRLDSGHQRWSIHASTVVNEQMAQTHRGEPFVFINREDAQKKGVEDGERVRVFNDFGDFTVQAKVSSLPEPGQLIIYHAWDPYQYDDWKSYDHVLPGLIKPLHLAGGYGHLRYSPSNWQPQQIDRHVSVDFEGVVETDD